MGTPNPAVTPLPSPTQDVLLKQYELHLKLYNHYLELVLKFNIFYYAVTGAVLSFYFTNNVDVAGLPRYLLLVFPVFMSLGFAGFFIWAAALVKYTRGDVIGIVNALGLRVFPEMHILAVLLVLSGSLFITVALGLMAIICHAMHR